MKPDHKAWQNLVDIVGDELSIETRVTEVEYACGDARITVSASTERSTAAVPGEYDVFEYAGEVLVRQVSYDVACDYAARLAEATGKRKVIEDLASFLDPEKPEEKP